MSLLSLIIRFSLFAAFVAWLSLQPGSVQVVWLNYEIKTSAAVLVGALLFLIVVTVSLYNAYYRIRSALSNKRLENECVQMRQGQELLAQSLSSIASGRNSEALSLAQKASKALGRSPLSQIVIARAAQANGREDLEKRVYEEMTQVPSTQVLGYKGLILDALRSGREEDAGKLCSRLSQVSAQPIPWLSSVSLDILTREAKWDRALEEVSKLRKAKGYEAFDLDQAEAAILLANAHSHIQGSRYEFAIVMSQRALKLRREWPQAWGSIINAYYLSGKMKSALKEAERAWHLSPHPDYVPLIRKLLEEKKPVDRYLFFLRLVKKNSSSYYSIMGLASFALSAGLWGEARRYLMSIVERGDATQRTYKLLSDLERKERYDERAATAWSVKAVTAEPESVWACQSCGEVHQVWVPLCTRCGAFNKIEWGEIRKARLSPSDAYSRDAIV